MDKLNRKFVLIFTIFSLLLLSSTVFAAVGDIPGTDINIIRVIFGREVPDDWLESQNILQFLVFPFFAVFIVLYGILEELSPFRNRPSLHGFLALVIAFMASSTGYLLGAVRYLYGFLGWFGAIGFGVILLFIGIPLYLYGKARGWKNQYLGVADAAKKMVQNEEDVVQLEIEIEKVRQELKLAPTALAQVAVLKKYEQLIDKWRKKRGWSENQAKSYLAHL